MSTRAVNNTSCERGVLDAQVDQWGSLGLFHLDHRTHPAGLSRRSSAVPTLFTLKEASRASSELSRSCCQPDDMMIRMAVSVELAKSSVQEGRRTAIVIRSVIDVDHDNISLGHQRGGVICHEPAVSAVENAQYRAPCLCIDGSWFICCCCKKRERRSDTKRTRN